MSARGRRTTALLVRQIVADPLGYDWSIQGFGMLRLYLAPDVRLHIWHSAFAVEDVSTIHDHPWAFRSEVICGELRNRVFRVVDGEATHHEQRIQCGEGGCLKGEPRDVRLACISDCVFGPAWPPSRFYEQDAADLHESIPKDGTVSIIERTLRDPGDPNHALVYFPLGTSWVSAEPRPATRDEIETFAAAALGLLDPVCASARAEESEKGE